MAVVAAAEDSVPLLLSSSDMSRSATSPSSSSTSALLLSHQLWYRGKLASWDSLAVKHKRRASRSATSPACSSTTQCLSLICKSRSVIWSLGTSRENQCHIAESASLDAILDFLESVTEEYEMKYVWMHPEQRYTLIRVKKRGYWEPLDDPNPRKSNGKRSATIINASSFF
uniref:Uncharacterized protein n=1 Tax=Oryza nivara TaxID=4536 RepID=A0A0E0IHK9_ORYNI